MVFHARKPITLKRWIRRSGGFPIGSSLPSHGAEERTRHTEKNQKRTKEEKKTKDKLQVNTEKNIGITIYMTHEQINVMMHALM